MAIYSVVLLVALTIRKAVCSPLAWPQSERHLQVGHGTHADVEIQHVDGKQVRKPLHAFRLQLLESVAHRTQRGQPQSLWNLMARVICR